jgi:hypothetical protein
MNRSRRRARRAVVALVEVLAAVAVVLAVVRLAPAATAGATTTPAEPASDGTTAAAVAARAAPASRVADPLPDDARAVPPPPVADLPNPAVRFVTYDLFVDPGARPLAAYQVDVRCTTNDALLTGLEGGDAVPFRDAPYYDPRALVNERIVVAAYSTAGEIAPGKARVARLHLRVEGKTDPKFEVTVTAAAGPDGVAIDATAAVERTAQ